MKNFKAVLILSLLSISTLSFAQRPDAKKVKVTGKVIEKSSSQPLEYATIVFQSVSNPDIVTGGITDPKGEFDIEVNEGTYNIRVEFISFKTVEFKNRTLAANTNLGTVTLSDDSTMLEGVELRAEASTVEIKLDKRVYNVGQDMMVKGGTVSDVLDNVPSVSVDVEGNVSLRGNENVRILIDGRPSNAINVTDALRLIPADAIDKVEVITNPSARYDAEGGGGILNIILKKGKNQGLNGVITGTVGDPRNYGLTGNINYKSENFNVFATLGYSDRNSPGNSKTDSEYFDADGNTTNFINERRTNNRLREAYNGSFGAEWFLDKTTSWTNTVSYRKDDGSNPDEVLFYDFDANFNSLGVRRRFNDQTSNGENVEYSSNLIKKFSKEGHQLTVDFSTSLNKDNDLAYIFDEIDQTTANIQSQNRNLFQTDYVLPLGENSRFEAGYRGDFSKVLTDFEVQTFNVDTNQFEFDPFSNVFEYKEYVNALYTQFGSKINKFSYLFGLRWEDSNIGVNLISGDDNNTKRYNNFFPSAFFAYEISEKSNVTLSYSRRIQRPRGRFLNPTANLSSNINIFQGNPDLDPAMTHAVDLGYIKRWQKFTLSTSAYINKTDDVFQFIRRESGDFFENWIDANDNDIRDEGEVTDIPIILSGPINLATEYRFGFEFTLNYTPYKWWRLNGNFNFFRNETLGDFNYINSEDEPVNINLDNVATSWFARINSKVTLPYGIDWQTNATYNAPQKTAQGKNLGVLSANLAISKDILKDKATIAFNVSDIFNSRKRIYEANLDRVNSSGEMQWRERQINLSITYRFNKPKNEKERMPRRENGDDGDFMGKP
ncbi:MAG TPA: TonB-dependent receptor [Flavobacterium sp.]|uniref:TonB-dependent receptor domain-containing protein n=1 Tax=unclassified Flavobacterium TaxID=196869 RepID=UPI000E9F8358|nr:MULTISPECIES: TonB-dependent receptor [unclassified Flavobacterium]HBI00304.1 TonB-dependent receptor [Flavobacterium sp.]HRE78112.1 TonB-dependent receptor [Flavobacterium sp.]